MSTVLVVDDDIDNRALLCLRLRLKGHDVISAGSAVEALLVVDEHGIPDLAVLDIVMPEISGLELLEHWRGLPLFADLPVIFLTAQDQESDALQAAGLHAQYLRKPVVIAVLEQAIDRALGLNA